MKEFTFTYHKRKTKNGSYNQDSTPVGKLFNQVDNVTSFLAKRYNLDVTNVEVINLHEVVNEMRKIKIVFK